MLAVGSALGQKMHHIASQHGLPNLQNGPKDGSWSPWGGLPRPQNGFRAASAKQTHRQKTTETNGKNNILNKSLFSAAYVCSWLPSWPQDGLQDLQHKPSKARNAPHILPTWPSKPPEWPRRWLLKSVGCLPSPPRSPCHNPTSQILRGRR